MSWCWRLVWACTALVAGVAFASDELTPLDAAIVAAGTDFQVRIRTDFDTVEGCFLVTPNNDTVQFMPEDLSDDKYQLDEPAVLHGCQVTIRNLEKGDSGTWELYYTTLGDGKQGSHYYRVTVTPREGEFKTEGSKEDENTDYQGPEMLSSIHHGARLGIDITITLSSIFNNEECYLKAPNGDVTKLEDTNIAGVQVFPTRTHFVACRVVIGPMDETLLGTWQLCGKSDNGQSEHERCQPTEISWAVNNPADNWHAITHPNFNHVVHYGFTLAPIVRGTGTLNTCHVITPAGEDITLTSDSNYPGLELVVFQRDTTACSVAFGPIDANFLGDWVLYGTYHSVVSDFNVVSLPMNFFLYDEDNPYSQAYNVSYLDEETHVLTEGVTVTIVVRGTGTRDSCEYIANSELARDDSSNEVLQASFVNNNEAMCRLQIGPITRDMFGSWTLIGKFSRNNLFTEFRLPFNLVEEDPANPLPDPIERSIEYLDVQNENADFGSSYTFTIGSGKKMSTVSCHIRTPDNLQYILRTDGQIAQSSFQPVVQQGVSCGVQVHVDNEDAIGEWMLIARINVRGNPIERRLPFNIRVEEEVNAVPNVATIARGNDLYVRLEEPTALQQTCTLTGPARNDAQRDENFVDTCGFIVNDVAPADTGIWLLEYGTRRKYRAYINVNVTGRFESQEELLNVYWTREAPLNETFGPENTAYCKVEAPSGLTVFEGFERCRIVLERVGTEHAGVWTMTIATVGQILAKTHELVVTLSEGARKEKVSTKVSSEKPLVMLSCEVESEDEVTACKFRDPSGRVLLLSPGVGEDRYTFHGVSIESNMTSRECGLRITDPAVEDLGLWRCTMETTTETYYGFLTVLCPWAMQDPTVAASVVTEPTLTSEREMIRAVEGELVTMRCSVQSAIRYCYFRTQNGTVYNVSPGTSDRFEYAGAGLDAGECSIRFPGLQAGDSGLWSCHVGFDHHEAEQRAEIQVHVDALMTAEQIRDPVNQDLVVSGQVHSRHSLSYCRFVRIDGLGFTSEDVPTGYEDHSLLANGKCEIRIREPSILDQHPWTVVAKILGQDLEIARSTTHTLVRPDEPIPERPGHGPRGSNFVVIWSCVLFLSLALFFVGLMLGPKKNREWTYQRATHVRNSMRRSFIKKPLPVEGNVQTAHTPMAA